MSVVIAVLGMHRSGTSCLTHVLHRAGMYLGTNLMRASHSSNLEGHLEAWEAVHINDRILHLSGGAWDRVPDTLRGDEQTGTQIAAFLDKLRRQPVAGWKDPRTTITFPLWMPHLANYRVVAALRHPLGVARSLELRDGLSREQGLHLWHLYNERLLQYAEQEPAFYLFDYDQPEEQIGRRLNLLCRQLDLRWAPAVGDVFNPFLRHHAPSQPLADKPVKRLYEALRERARSQMHDSEMEAAREYDPRLTKENTDLGSLRSVPVAEPPSLTSPTWPKDNHRLAERRRATNRQLSKLVRIYQLQNVLMQEYSRWQVDVMQQNAAWEASIGELRRRQDECCEVRPKVVQRLEQLAAELAALRAKQEEQANHMLECHGFVFRVRNSLPFRLHRALAEQVRALRSCIVSWIGRVGSRSGRKHRERVPDGDPLPKGSHGGYVTTWGEPESSPVEARKLVSPL